MFKKRLRNPLFVLVLLVLNTCNQNSGLQPSDDRLPVSVSGRILYPDTGLMVYLISNRGIDSTTPDPVTKKFVFDSLDFGLQILQVRATDFAPFEQKLILDKKEFVFHDITLTQFPMQIPIIDPPNSQYIDSVYANLYPPPVTDSGLSISINFREYMDTTSVNDALVLLPDTAGIQKIWTLDINLSLFIPYARLAQIENLQVTIKKTAFDRFGDSLDHDFTVFYPVDTAYMQRIRVKRPENRKLFF